ncbi:MAG: hypothetical protein WBG01_07960 [Bacteroidota bacterium]
MKKTVFFWILAFIITAGSAVYQRMTGPSYPVSGSAPFAGAEVSYRFARSHGEDSDHTVRLQADSAGTSAVLEWKRYKTDDPWSVARMRFAEGDFAAELPQQPPAGKLQYRVGISGGGRALLLPGKEPVVIRFRGEVPTMVLILHVITIFGAMLLSTRTGLEYFNPNPRLGRLVAWTIGFLVVGGMILGPVVQKYAFGAFWTGWPFGTDLTDNKTLLGLIAWFVAAGALLKAKNPRRWTLAASIILLVVFLIPHSLLGSELDYRELDEKGASPDSLVRE